MRFYRRQKSYRVQIAVICILLVGAGIFLATRAEQGRENPAIEECMDITPGEAHSHAVPVSTPEVPPALPTPEIRLASPEYPAEEYIPDDSVADSADDLPNDPPDAAVAEVDADNPPIDAGHAFFETEMPILVNRDNTIPDDYDPDLVSIGNGFYLNRRAAAAWHAMQAAAAQDGINIWVISAYRSHEVQERNFNNLVAQHIAAGRSQEQAQMLSAAYIAVPGTSEHQLGLAIDINQISNAFEHTPEFAWLMENGARFGFIFRYPRDTTHITGINFEPWHFRYVGSNHAAIIMEMGIVLEEYMKMFESGG